MPSKIISISGFSGSGKSAVSNFLKNKKSYRVISISETMKEVFEKMIPNFNDITEAERQKKILGVLNKDPSLPSETIQNKVKNEASKEEVIVLDGVRSERDFAYLTKDFKIIKFFVFTDFTTRLSRVKNRDSCSDIELLLKRDRLDNEVGLLDLFKEADYILFNCYDSDISESIDQLLEILEKEGL